MLLAIDAGNTNIVFAVFRGETLVESWRIGTRRERTGDEYGLVVRALFDAAGLPLEAIRAVAISNVVPPMTPALRQFARRYLRCEPAFVGEQLQPRLPIRYHPPGAVGADRLVDAVAVLRLYGAPAVFVDFGTATTFNAISAEGEYLGGAIAPGIGISLEALFRTAAHLPRIELARPDRVIGASTVESMQSGAYYGFLCQAEGMIRRFRAELGPGARAIATGGFAELIAPEIEGIDAVDPLLTLKGLRLVWEEQAAAAEPT